MKRRSVLHEKILSQYIGLDLYNAKKRIVHDFPEIDDHGVDITYAESSYPRFTILECFYNEKTNHIRLTVSSQNPIRLLPSNFQQNDFLRRFLMIFQHILNDTTLKLDNLHDYFRPMEAPVSFLPVLADWLGIHLDTLGGETEIRKFLQYAIPLYRLRGTAIGLKAHLAIITGITPDIIEGQRGYAPMLIHDNAEVSASLFEAEADEHCFTMYFPVERERFDDTLIRRISLIVQREKPVHTKAYISFLTKKARKRKVTIIEKDNSMDIEGVIYM